MATKPPTEIDGWWYHPEDFNRGYCLPCKAVTQQIEYALATTGEAYVTVYWDERVSNPYFGYVVYDNRKDADWAMNGWWKPNQEKSSAQYRIKIKRKIN